MEKTYTLQDAAAMTGLTTRTLRTYLQQGFLRGEITERQLVEGTLQYYTGPGICPFLGTANTMGALCESLGMMLPGGSLIPA